MDNFVIVTRHNGLVQWLAGHGITGSVIAQAAPSDVKGKDVVGVLPLHLASMAKSITVVDMPGLRPDQRGTNLTPDEMDQAGATMSKYVVTKVS